MCAAHYKIDPVELKMTALYKNPLRDYRVPSTLLLQIHCKKDTCTFCMLRFFPPLLTFLEPVQCPPTARHRSGKPSFYLLPALSRLSQALNLFLRSLRKTFLSRVDCLSCVASNPLITCLDLWRVVGSLQQVVSYPQRTAPRLPSLPSLARLVWCRCSHRPPSCCHRSRWLLLHPSIPHDRGGSSTSCRHPPSCLARRSRRCQSWLLPSPPRLPSPRLVSQSPPSPLLRNLRLRSDRARPRLPSLSPSASAASPRPWSAPPVLLSFRPLWPLLSRLRFLLPLLLRRLRSLALSAVWPG